MYLFNVYYYLEKNFFFFKFWVERILLSLFQDDFNFVGTNSDPLISYLKFFFNFNLNVGAYTFIYTSLTCALMKHMYLK